MNSNWTLVVPGATTTMKKKDKCPECGCPAFELVSSKEPDIINIVCFHCGEIIDSCHKDELDDKDINAKEE